jgi:endoglycosylceramidase
MLGHPRSLGVHGFSDVHAKQLQDSGFSLVRLGVYWENIQPFWTADEPFYFDRYLDSISRTIGLLAKYKIYTLIDIHQDAFSSPWGFGAPSWAVLHNGTNSPYVGFPKTDFCIEGVTATAVCKAMDHFWSNGTSPYHKDDKTTLRVYYIMMARHVARHFSAMKGSIYGYDPMNEPTPGSLWVESLNSAHQPLDVTHGTPHFDAILAEFYEAQLIPAIRSAHPEATIYFETSGLFGLGAKTWLPGFSERNLGLNFHNYDVGMYDSRHDRPVRNAEAYQAKHNMPLVCTEFSQPSNLPNVRGICDVNDMHMISWTYWPYYSNARYVLDQANHGVPDDPRAQNIVRDLHVPLDAPNNTNYELLLALTRVYPRVTAGTPLHFLYNTTENSFAMKYSTTLPNGSATHGGTSVIVAPEVLCENFDATVVGGTAARSAEDPSYFDITADKGVTIAQLRIHCPGGGSKQRGAGAAPGRRGPGAS